MAPTSYMYMISPFAKVSRGPPLCYVVIDYKCYEGTFRTKLHDYSVLIWSFLINIYQYPVQLYIHTCILRPTYSNSLKGNIDLLAKGSAIIPVQLPPFSRRRVANTQMRHLHLLVQQPNIIMLRNEETKTSKKRRPPKEVRIYITQPEPVEREVELICPGKKIYNNVDDGYKDFCCNQYDNDPFQMFSL